jgi:hypothetical protein
MPITPTGGWLDPLPDNQPNGCPSCGSTDWKSANLVHLEGMSVSRFQIRGNTIGAGKVGLHNGQFAVGVGRTRSTAFGQSQTALSKMATPPQSRRGLKIFLFVLIVFFSIGLVNNIQAENLTVIAIFIGIIVFLCLSLYRVVVAQQNEYEEDIYNYENAKVCQRCGTFYNI